MRQCHWTVSVEFHQCHPFFLLSSLPQIQIPLERFEGFGTKIGWHNFCNEPFPISFNSLENVMSSILMLLNR